MLCCAWGGAMGMHRLLGHSWTRHQRSVISSISKILAWPRVCEICGSWPWRLRKQHRWRTCAKNETWELGSRTKDGVYGIHIYTFSFLWAPTSINDCDQGIDAKRDNQMNFIVYLIPKMEGIPKTFKNNWSWCISFESSPYVGTGALFIFWALPIRVFHQNLNMICLGVSGHTHMFAIGGPIVYTGGTGAGRYLEWPT